MKLLLLILSVYSVCSVGHTQDSLPRTALLMGVGDYGGAKYKGQSIQNLPGILTADLPGMESKLKTLGFDVTVVPNPTLSQAKTAVDAFSARIKARPGVSLFYFSGHGGEYEGKNFLIPRGASISSAADLSDEALSAQRVLNGMEESGAQVNLVFLDCCREDLGKNIGGAELQPMKARGSFIGFATRSGDFADPGAEGSPYTRFLLQHLDRPGLSVADMYGYVIRDVKDYTKKMLGEERRPGFYSELEGDPFYFVPVKLTAPQTVTPAMTEAEIERRARELAAKMAPGAPPASVPSLPATNGTILDQGAIGKAIQVKLPGDVFMKFSFCPPGSFMMGSPKSEADRSDEEDQVQVRLSKGFWMAQTEVTQTQWKALMGSNPSEFKGDDLPVEMVSWEDAQTLITKLNQSVPLPAGWKYELPTEAQWEYACRAGAETAFSFGESPAQLAQHGNFADKNFTIDSWGDKAQDDGVGDTTAQVARYRANAWGLYDMHGNVWEWCADWKADKLLGGTDPDGPSKGAFRVRRGGSWVNFAAHCRAASRDGVGPGNRAFTLGFRPALVPSNP